MRQAVLDIGTNTVKLLVAETRAQPSLRISPILEDAVTTRIGEGVHKSGELDREAMKRTLDVIARFASRARELGAEKVFAFATSAVRDAANGRFFLAETRARMGVELEILSGETEARYAFAGVTSDEAFAAREIVTIDIGGGSTEICFGDAQGLKAHDSLDIGAVRLTEMFCQNDPMTECEFAEMGEFAASQLRKLPPEFPTIAARRDAGTEPPPLIATGGTAMTLAAIELCHSGRARPFHPVSDAQAIAPSGDRFPIDHHELATLPQLADGLRRMPLDERKKVAGLPSARADIIVAGATILWEAMRFFGAHSVTVSVRGARYGALVIGLRAAA